MFLPALRKNSLGLNMEKTTLPHHEDLWASCDLNLSVINLNLNQIGSTHSKKFNQLIQEMGGGGGYFSLFPVQS